MATKELKTLEEILMADIKKDDKAKALEQVARVVRDAKHASQGELHNAVVNVDSAEDTLKKVINNPSSSLTSIMEAQRNLKLAEANLAELQTIFETRFPK